MSITNKQTKNRQKERERERERERKEERKKGRKKEKKLPYDPAIPLLDVSPKDSKPAQYGDIYMSMCIAALVTMAKIQNQTRCLTEEQIEKIWFIYMKECFQP